MASRSEALNLRITVEGKEAAREVDRFTGKVKTSSEQMNQSAKKTAKSFTSLGAAVTKAGIALGALTGAALVVDRMARQADRIDSVGRAFGTLTRRTGETADVFLRKMKPAARSLISDMELMRQANNAIILGLPVTSDSMAELVENSVKLGRALGIDATRAIESMITGIGRQSRLMLDNIGIIVKADLAYRTYAESLGVAASELTEQQKKLAFFEAASEAARVGVQGLDDDVKTLSQGLISLKTDIVNVTNAFLDFVNKAPARAIQAARNAAVGIVNSTQDIDRQFPESVPLPAFARRLSPLEKRRADAAAAALEIRRQGAVITQGINDAFEAWSEALFHLRVAQRAQRREFLPTAEHPGMGDPARGPLTEPFDITANFGAQADPLAVQGGPPTIGAPFPTIEMAQGQVEDLGATIEQQIGVAGANAIADFGVSMVSAFAAGKASAEDMFKSLLLGLAQAIAKMVILNALSKVNPLLGAGAAAGAAAAGNNRHGGYVPQGAQFGAIVPGRDRGNDSVLMALRPGERVIPREQVQRELRGGKQSGGGITVNIQADVMDATWWEANHENVAAAMRRAARMGTA